MHALRMTWRKLARGVDLLSLATLVLGAFVAIAAPLDILTRSPVLAAFADTCAAALPVIAQYTSKSQFPEVTKLYMALMFCGSPWFFASGFFSQMNAAPRHSQTSNPPPLSS
jgi:hypothetical protein